MSKNFDSNIDGNIDVESGDVDGECVSNKQASVQSSDGKTSTQPGTSDDTTSDECKPQPTKTEDGDDHAVQHARPQPSALHRNVNKSFSQQLMHMLSCETKGGNDAVQWLPDGSGFVIKRQNEFEQHIMPRYFDSPCIFQSFMRRLYRWGFKQMNKSTAGSGNYIFSNATFHRDNDMYLEMKALPRGKSEHQETSKQNGKKEKKDSVDASSSSEKGCSSYKTALAGSQQPAHSAAGKANATTSSITHAQGGGEPGVTRPPHPSASASNNLTSLLTTLVANNTYPQGLSTQNDSTNILHGITPAQLAWIQQQLQTLNNNMTQASLYNSQSQAASIIDGIIRSLTQTQLFIAPSQAIGFQPPNTMQQVTGQILNAPGQALNSFLPNMMQFVPGQAPNLLPQVNNGVNTITSAQLPNAISGAPLDQTSSQLSAPIQRRLRQMPGNQAQAQSQADRHAIHPNSGVVGPNSATPTASPDLMPPPNNLNVMQQQHLMGAASFPDTMQEDPSAYLGDSQFSAPSQRPPLHMPGGPSQAQAGVGPHAAFLPGATAPRPTPDDPPSSTSFSSGSDTSEFPTSSSSDDPKHSPGARKRPRSPSADK